MFLSFLLAVGGIAASFSGKKLAVQAGTTATMAVGVQAGMKVKSYEREQRLGINSYYEKKTAEKRDALAKKMGPELAAQAYPSTLTHFTIGPQDVPLGQERFIGEYLLTNNEFKQLMDGIRHDALEKRLGSWSDDLQSLLDHHGMPRECLEDFYGGHGVDFYYLQDVSRERLKDPEFRRLAGLGPLPAKKRR